MSRKGAGVHSSNREVGNQGNRVVPKGNTACRPWKLEKEDLWFTVRPVKNSLRAKTTRGPGRGKSLRARRETEGNAPERHLGGTPAYTLLRNGQVSLFDLRSLFPLRSRLKIALSRA